MVRCEARALGKLGGAVPRHSGLEPAGSTANGLPPETGQALCQRL